VAGLDLSGLDLSVLFLPYASFACCSLDGLSLRDTHLWGGVFVG